MNLGKYCFKVYTFTDERSILIDLYCWNRIADPDRFKQFHIGFGFALITRSFELWYCDWLCRLYIGAWLFALWFDFPLRRKLDKSK